MPRKTLNRLVSLLEDASKQSAGRSGTLAIALCLASAGPAHALKGVCVLSSAGLEAEQFNASAVQSNTDKLLKYGKLTQTAAHDLLKGEHQHLHTTGSSGQMGPSGDSSHVRTVVQQMWRCSPKSKRGERAALQTLRKSGATLSCYCNLDYDGLNDYAKKVNGSGAPTPSQASGDGSAAGASPSGGFNTVRNGNGPTQIPSGDGSYSSPESAAAAKNPESYASPESAAAAYNPDGAAQRNNGQGIASPDSAAATYNRDPNAPSDASTGGFNTARTGNGNTEIPSGASANSDAAAYQPSEGLSKAYSQGAAAAMAPAPAADSAYQPSEGLSKAYSQGAAAAMAPAPAAQSYDPLTSVSNSVAPGFSDPNSAKAAQDPVGYVLPDSYSSPESAKAANLKDPQAESRDDRAPAGTASH